MELVVVGVSEVEPDHQLRFGTTPGTRSGTRYEQAVVHAHVSSVIHCITTLSGRFTVASLNAWGEITGFRPASAASTRAP
ncbi:hypothetical protein [Streptomyces sp. NPDC060065]|uniref:hypothetical protein n=1 Tax=Streptomyces sp. NPDC060065 TaxID=3347050 RepID=UPI00367CED68